MPSLARQLGPALLVVLAALPRPAAAGPLSWESEGPDGGPVDGLVQCPSNADRFYCIPHGLGVHRSDDGGATWARVDTGLALDTTMLEIAVSPTDEDLVLLGWSGGLYRSSDGGVTWAAPALAGNVIRSISFDPLDPQAVLLAASGTGWGVYRSTDAGLSWAHSNDGLPAVARRIVFQPAVPGAVLAPHAQGISRSTDGGQSWADVEAADATELRTLAFCESEPTRAYALGYGRCLRSDDGGVSFSDVTPAYYNPYAVAVDPLDPDAVLVASLHFIPPLFDLGRVLIGRSTDGGETWEYPWESQSAQPEDERVGDLILDAAHPGVVHLAIASGDDTPRTGLLRSTDGGSTWSRSMTGIRALEILGIDRDGEGAAYVRSPHKGGLFVAQGPEGELVERASADDWPTAFDVREGSQGEIHELGQSKSWDALETLYRRSTDGGETWADGPLPFWEVWEEGRLVRCDHTAGETVYVWSTFSYLVRLLRKDTFAAPFTVIPVGFLPADAFLDPSDPYRVFAVDAAEGDVLLSTNGGASWLYRSGGLPTDSPRRFLVDTLDPGPGWLQHFLVVYENAGIRETTDAGFSWAEVPIDPGITPIVDADWDPATGRIFLASESDGVWISGLGVVNDGLPTRALTSIRWFPDSDRLLVGTEHASVHSLDLAAPVAAPAAGPGAERSGLALAAAPSPFTSAVSLELSLPSASGVEVEVFAVDGRRVATIHSGPLPAGRHVLEWNGWNAAGPAAAGVYFVRARAGGEEATRRVVRLRAR